MNNPVYLHGLAIQFFRGIGPEIQKLHPFKHFNFFVGANNAGKSTILDFIDRYLSKNAKGPRAQALDRYTGKQTGELKFALGISKAAFTDAVMERHKARSVLSRETIETILTCVSDDGFVWIIPDESRQRSKFLSGPDKESLKAILPPYIWQQFWTLLTQSSGGDLSQHWIPHSLDALLECQSLKLPSVRFVPTNRQIGTKDDSFADYSGRGLINRLAELQNPGHDKREEYLVFQKINSFLKTVTGRPSAKIEVPHNREHILVHMDNKVLPLANLGTGIHEVIMLSAFCTISEEQIICIEEPETHLHPLLQRKLIQYLKQNTSNQYFIATHSASFIDTPDAAVFHVTNDGSQTKIEESILKRQRVAVCADLGVRASDIVQSNFVVWVEGPSDRIYIRHWIKTIGPELEEGTHFSIMFYGGRLLNHLSADDSEVTEFIQLRMLNQNLCIVMDSDKEHARSRINGTKQRILHEFASTQGKAWITSGREIENYIEHAVLQAAVRKLYPKKYHSPLDGDRFSHALHYRTVAKDGRKPSKIETSIDKVSVARLVTEQSLSLGVLDLRKHVEELVERIQVANA